MYRWGATGFVDLVDEARRFDEEVLGPAARDVDLGYEPTRPVAADRPNRDHLLGIRLSSGTAVDLWLDEYDLPLEYSRASGPTAYEDFRFDDAPVGHGSVGRTGTVALVMEADTPGSGEADADYHLFADAVSERIDADLRLYSVEDETLYGFMFDVSDGPGD